MTSTTESKELYLLFEKEISAEQFECIVNNIGTEFPDGQVIAKGDAYILRADQEPDEVEKVLINKLAKLGVTYPTA